MLTDLRHVPKSFKWLDAGDAFVALCILLSGGYLLYKTGVWT